MTHLAARIQSAAEQLIGTVEAIEDEAWSRVPGPGVWSVGKEAEHVAEGMALHLWVVRVTIGQAAISKRPRVEREQMTTALSRDELVVLLRTRASKCASVVGGLTEAQLVVPTKPPRTGNPSLAETIERMMIRHIDGHREEIVAKLAGGR